MQLPKLVFLGEKSSLERINLLFFNLELTLLDRFTHSKLKFKNVSRLGLFEIYKISFKSRLKRLLYDISLDPFQ